VKAAWLFVLAAAGCDVMYEPDVGKLQPPDAEPGPAPDDSGVVMTAGKCDDSSPMVSVSFSRDIRPMLSKSPGGCTCHSSNTTSGLNLGSYENLKHGGMNSGTRIIVPGKPCESILPQKLGLAPPFGARMPYNGPPYFSAAELTLVRDWIAEGALDN
jgi:hypothetical protein